MDFSVHGVDPLEEEEEEDRLLRLRLLCFFLCLRPLCEEEDEERLLDEERRRRLRLFLRFISRSCRELYSGELRKGSSEKT